ncbi:MAG: hypothetical protein QOK43_448 [Acidimicrobiaceae bacterium]|nr:hypothetical protein [Acidimicrobiaceae bacterium]
MIDRQQTGLVRRARRTLSVAVAALMALSSTALVVHDQGVGNGGRTLVVSGARHHFDEAAALQLADVTTTTTSTTSPPPPPTTTPPAPPTTARPAPKPAPRPTTTVARPAGTLSAARLKPPAVPVGLAPYVGLGTWSDVYDWSNSYTNGHPGTGPADVDQMAAKGVQTLYIQASKWDAPGDLVDPDLLMPILRRAKERGLRVVAWYLPTLTDPQRDLDRMVAMARLADVDSVAVDIESRTVSDVNDRNHRLIQFSQALRQALPGRTIGAIALPPVVLEVVNPDYWPNFPYKEIAPSYDVWMTMGYWTNRKASSGYRDAYRYTRENVERLRVDVGRADLPVHPIGGLGQGTTAADVEAYRKAAIDTTSIGGSLYDWRTTAGECWTGLAGFRA